MLLIVREIVRITILPIVPFVASSPMPSITANDLKTRGIAAIEASLAAQPEATITVRGAERFVVMALDHYHYLRECELEAALAQTRADLAAGRSVQESPGEHVARALAQGDGAPAVRRTSRRR
jgi:PHD/YefM family antitoxin component YafN of YafNO toxin-antitoxin module